MERVPTGKYPGFTGSQYANYILSQLKNIGKPITSKTTSTATTEGGGEGLDLASLAMLLYFMLGNKGTSTTTLQQTGLPPGRTFGGILDFMMPK